MLLRNPQGPLLVCYCGDLHGSNCVRSNHVHNRFLRVRCTRLRREKVPHLWNMGIYSMTMSLMVSGGAANPYWQRR